MSDDAGVPLPEGPLTMSVADAAKRLGVSEGWYATQLRAKKLPGHKMGNRWRLTEEDVQGALERTFVPPLPIAPRDPGGLRPATRRRLEREVDPAGLTPGSRRRLDRGR